MKTTKFDVKISGYKPIMFDRFVSMTTTISLQEKFYFDPPGDISGIIVFPAVNIMSFLSAQLTECATARTFGKTWKKKGKAAMSYVDIKPTLIPILKNGSPIGLADITRGVDWDINYSKACVKKGGGLIIPSPKERPFICLPWKMNFQLELIENKDLSDNDLKKIFDEGGITTGFGTYRGLYGKFNVEEWIIS